MVGAAAPAMIEELCVWWLSTMAGANCCLDAAAFVEKLSAIGDSPGLEDWLLLRREQLDRQLLRALSSLAALYEGRREHEEALARVRRIIELQPWQEEARGQAVRLLALAGRRSEALGQFLRCRDLMMRELGAEPGPETAALRESIRAGTPPPTRP